MNRAYWFTDIDWTNVTTFEIAAKGSIKSRENTPAQVSPKGLVAKANVEATWTDAAQTVAYGTCMNGMHTTDFNLRRRRELEETTILLQGAETREGFSSKPQRLLQGDPHMPVRSMIKYSDDSDRAEGHTGFPVAGVEILVGVVG